MRPTPSNLAQMTSLKELWQNLPFESFPPLWPLISARWGFLGLADSDAGVRILGLVVGLLFSHRCGDAPAGWESHAYLERLRLLGRSASIIFIIGANRAYGLASCLLVAQFWNALAGGGVSFTVAGSLGGSHLLSFRTLRLL